MRKRYSSEIMPIEQAYARRQALIDEQRKAMQQDSTILFDRPASTLSLDELIANPAISPQSYSGSLLTKQVGTAAQNLAKEARENPRKWRTILGNQYYETIMQRGFRPEEVIQAISNNPNASPILRSMVEDAIGSSGLLAGMMKKHLTGLMTMLDKAYGKLLEILNTSRYLTRLMIMQCNLKWLKLRKVWQEKKVDYHH